jgi:RNA polymerase sigma-70 factor (ECF subfamily)
MFSFAEITTLQLAGGGEGVVGSTVLGLFTREADGGNGIRSDIVAIYDELRPLLYRNLIFLGFDPNEADDVIQEAFLGLVRQREAGRTIEDARGWIFRATYSLSLNAQRQQRKIGLRGEEAEMHVRSLPGQQRQCISLRREGLRYREIAVALGVSPSRVPQLLERAVCRLMEELHG